MDSARLLIVAVGELRLGIPLECVERVVHAVEITPLANAPPAILGVVNLHGEVVPVLDPRIRFRQPVRPLDPGDVFILVRLPRGAVALVADDAQDVAEFDADCLVAVEHVQPWLQDIAGLVRLEDGLLVVDDPARFLDAEGWSSLAVQLEASA